MSEGNSGSQKNSNWYRAREQTLNTARMQLKNAGIPKTSTGYSSQKCGCACVPSCDIFLAPAVPHCLFIASSNSPIMRGTGSD